MTYTSTKESSHTPCIRIHRCNDKSINIDGSYVLYWMDWAEKARTELPSRGWASQVQQGER